MSWRLLTPASMTSRAKSGSPNLREREGVEEHLESAPEQKRKAEQRL
jgi:hypothetical protein